MNSTENPYQPPRVRGTAEASGKTPRWWLRACDYLCVGLSLLAIAGYAFTAWMLIPQAARLEAEALNYLPPFRNQDDKMIRASWVLGYGSILLALTTSVAAVLALQRRTLAAWSLLLLGFVAYVVLAIVLNPT